MDPILAFTQASQDAIIETIRQMVEVESPSDDRDAVNRHVEQLCDMLSGEAELTREKGGSYGDHLLVEFNLPGKKKTGQVLAMGHTDTVYPLGILKTMPFRVADGRLWGPGVLDMKGGVAFLSTPCGRCERWRFRWRRKWCCS